MADAVALASTVFSLSERVEALTGAVPALREALSGDYAFAPPPWASPLALDALPPSRPPRAAPDAAATGALWSLLRAPLSASSVCKRGAALAPSAAAAPSLALQLDEVLVEAVRRRRGSALHKAAPGAPESSGRVILPGSSLALEDVTNRAPSTAFPYAAETSAPPPAGPAQGASAFPDAVELVEEALVSAEGVDRIVAAAEDAIAGLDPAASSYEADPPQEAARIPAPARAEVAPVAPMDCVAPPCPPSAPPHHAPGRPPRASPADLEAAHRRALGMLAETESLSADAAALAAARRVALAQRRAAEAEEEARSIIIDARLRVGAARAAFESAAEGLAANAHSVCRRRKPCNVRGGGDPAVASLARAAAALCAQNAEALEALHSRIKASPRGRGDMTGSSGADGFESASGADADATLVASLIRRGSERASRPLRSLLAAVLVGLGGGGSDDDEDWEGRLRSLVVPLEREAARSSAAAARTLEALRDGRAAAEAPETEAEAATAMAAVTDTKTVAATNADAPLLASAATAPAPSVAVLEAYDPSAEAHDTVVAHPSDPPRPARDDDSLVSSAAPSVDESLSATPSGSGSAVSSLLSEDNASAPPVAVSPPSPHSTGSVTTDPSPPLSPRPSGSGSPVPTATPPAASNSPDSLSSLAAGEVTAPSHPPRSPSISPTPSLTPSPAPSSPVQPSTVRSVPSSSALSDVSAPEVGEEEEGAAASPVLPTSVVRRWEDVAAVAAAVTELSNGSSEDSYVPLRSISLPPELETSKSCVDVGGGDQGRGGGGEQGRAQAGTSAQTVPQGPRVVDPRAAASDSVSPEVDAFVSNFIEDEVGHRVSIALVAAVAVSEGHRVTPALPLPPPSFLHAARQGRRGVVNCQ